MASSRAAEAAAALAVALTVLPFATNDFVAYQIALFLIYGIATQGVALCWGRLGFLPLGNALFFGLGAYMFGGTLKAAQSDPGWWGLAPLALAVPALLAYVVGRLVFARNLKSGPYFSLITLAMTMLGFLAAQQWRGLTGGFNGMANVPELPGTDRYATLYWVIAGCAVATTTALSLLFVRPLGVLWSAVAQNEDRLQLFGYATDRIKAGAYALSAGLAALAGALFAAHQGIVTPDALGFVLSTEFVIWAAVGGKGSALGALLGAVVVGYASAELRDRFDSWEVFIGLLFIAVVRFLPDGIAGLLRRRPPPPDPRPMLAAPAAIRVADPLRLRFEGVHTSQAGVKILDGLDLVLEGPGIRSVIGPNGAGKTSSFNVMTGRLPLVGGRIVLDGRDIGGMSGWRVARRGVGRKLQIPSVFPALTVRQNLLIALWAGRLHGAAALRVSPLRWHSALLDDLMSHFPNLERERDTPAGHLSQGHRQALELVMTVLPEPRLVLLDEPCAGLSPDETQHMIAVIQAAVQRIGAAALLIEHDISAVAAMGGEVFVLHQGRKLAQGSLAEVQADPAVRAVYAGGRK
jgi:branched-chain amino acid transport system permease protein